MVLLSMWTIGGLSQWLLIALLGFLIWGVKHYVSKNDSKHKDHYSNSKQALEIISKAITSIEKNTAAQEIRNKQTSDYIQMIFSSLKDHGKRLDEHGEQLAKINGKLEK